MTFQKGCLIPSGKTNKTFQNVAWLLLPYRDIICKPPLCESNGLPGQISSSCHGWQWCPGFHNRSAAQLSDEKKHNSCNALPCPTEGAVFCSASVSGKVLGSIYFFIDQTLLAVWVGPKCPPEDSVRTSPFYIFEQKSVCIYFCKVFFQMGGPL